MLLKVWEKRNNVKVNPVLDEIATFLSLERLMKEFEFNVINNIYVPTDEELEQLVDIASYQKQTDNILLDRNLYLKSSSLHLQDNPKDMNLSPYTLLTRFQPADINDFTENILSRLPVKNIEIPKHELEGLGDGGGKRQSNLVTEEMNLNQAVLSKRVSRKSSVNPNDLPSDVNLEQIQLRQDNFDEEGRSLGNSPNKARVISHKGLDKLLELEEWPVTDWEEVHQSEFIHIYKRKEENSPVIMIKAYTTLRNLPPEKVFRLIYDLEIRAEWDNVLSNMYIFDKVNENIDHMYSLYKAPFGISNRDFCQRRTKSMGYKGSSFMIHFESVEHPECPAIKSNVRAHTTISGYIIRPDPKNPGSTLMTILTQTDIKGLVPKFIVNTAAAKAPKDWTKNFIKNAERLIAEGIL